MNSFLTKPPCEKNNLFPAVFLLCYRVFVRTTLSATGQRDIQLGLYHKGTCLLVDVPAQYVHYIFKCVWTNMGMIPLYACADI
jgi:hypothetical protein